MIPSILRKDSIDIVGVMNLGQGLEIKISEDNPTQQWLKLLQRKMEPKLNNLVPRFQNESTGFHTDKGLNELTLAADYFDSNDEKLLFEQNKKNLAKKYGQGLKLAKSEFLLD